jgi:hypothetical protein
LIKLGQDKYLENIDAEITIDRLNKIKIPFEADKYP